MYVCICIIYSYIFIYLYTIYFDIHFILHCIYASYIILMRIYTVYISGHCVLIMWMQTLTFICRNTRRDTWSRVSTNGKLYTNLWLLSTCIRICTYFLTLDIYYIAYVYMHMCVYIYKYTHTRVYPMLYSSTWVLRALQRSLDLAVAAIGDLGW